MAGTITGETKRVGQRKFKRQPACRNQKRERKLVPLVVGSYLTHGPYNVRFMLIVRPNNNGNNGGLEHASLINTIFLSIAKSKARGNAILKNCMKN
jgi:hypothetical protein